MTLEKFKTISPEDKDRIRQEIINECALVADCWIYPVTNSAGYGVKRIGNKVQTTSRFMLAYHTRESMNISQDACHIRECPYRACCNPIHLQWGSHSINAKVREADERDARRSRLKEWHESHPQLGQRAHPQLEPGVDVHASTDLEHFTAECLQAKPSIYTESYA